MPALEPEDIKRVQDAFNRYVIGAGERRLIRQLHDERQAITEVRRVCVGCMVDIERGRFYVRAATAGLEIHAYGRYGVLPYATIARLIRRAEPRESEAQPALF